ncbi:MAG: hypothetical protein LBK95_14090 [Bifidobacteriaceae bacterium]|jgi:hypothetical protein|nr:hypothetical protein [Bifidobacteriaceae bacterium]
MPFDPSQGEFAARGLLAHPSTAGSDLGVIAGSFPALLTQVAMHPSLYPALEAWLRQLHRPDIDAALQIRGAQAAGGFRPQGPVFVAPPAPTTGTMPSTGLAPTPRLAPVVGAAPQAGATPLPGAAPVSSEPLLSGPQAVFGVPSVGASPSFLGGSPLAGAMPLPGPRPLAAPAARPAKRRRRGLAIIGAAATVVALAATAGWFIATRPPEPLPGDLIVAPDFTAEPVLEELVDLTKAFPGVNALRVEGFLDDTTVLVSSRPDSWIGDSDWYQGYDEDYERGAADSARFEGDYAIWRACVNSGCDGPDCEDRECVEPNRGDYFDRDSYLDLGYCDGFDGKTREAPPATGGGAGTFLAAVAFDSPTEPKWRLDLNEALHEQTLYFDCGYIPVHTDGRGNWLASVGTESDPTGGECYRVAVDSDGEILSWATAAADASGEVQLVDGFVVAGLNGDPPLRVGVYRPDDLGSPVWEAGCSDFGCYLVVVDGKVWVTTHDGLVDLATGEDVGFDRQLTVWEYVIGSGGGIFILDWTWGDEYGGLTRVGLDGSEMWDSAVPTSDLVVEFDGSRAYLTRGDAMVGVDAATGEERWSTTVGRIGWFCPAGNGNLVVTVWDDAEGLAILDGESGQVLAGDLPGALEVCGREMVYAIDQSRLVGYSAEAARDGGNAELWSLALPEGDVDGPLVSPAGLIYFTVAQYDTVNGPASGSGSGKERRMGGDAMWVDSLVVYRLDSK